VRAESAPLPPVWIGLNIPWYNCREFSQLQNKASSPNESRIYVRVIGKTTSTKELEIYFQSRKQSGDGDISKIEQINEKESVITFEDHEGKR